MHDDDLDGLTRAHSWFHLWFGWWALLVFLATGIGLEMLHGFKVRWYLDVENEARRLMWTLGHTHGTLLALVNLAFAVSLTVLPLKSRRALKGASRCLLGATLLLPGGFFLGGVGNIGGDPGVGILLVPVGALLLLVGVLIIARGATLGTARGGARSVVSESKRASKSRTA